MSTSEILAVTHHVIGPIAHPCAIAAIVFENVRSYQRTYALKAAIELDVFRAVGQGPATLCLNPSLRRRDQHPRIILERSR